MGYLHTATLRIGDAEVVIRACSESDDPDDVFGEWFGRETMRPGGRASTRWTDQYEARSITLDDVQAVSDKEYDVLTQYLPERS